MKQARIFISYSHQDTELFAEVRDHLQVMLSDSGIAESWDDTDLVAGERWHDQIQGTLVAADVALCLVSAKYLVSSYIEQYELPYIIKQAQAGKLTLFWVLVKPVSVPMPLAGFQAAYPPQQALEAMDSAARAEACSAIATTIRAVLEQKGYGHQPEALASSTSFTVPGSGDALAPVADSKPLSTTAQMAVPTTDSSTAVAVSSTPLSSTAHMAPRIPAVPPEAQAPTNIMPVASAASTVVMPVEAAPRQNNTALWLLVGVLVLALVLVGAFAGGAFGGMGPASIDDIVTEHQRYLSSKGKVGQQADLSNRDLRGYNFHSANLSDADLSNANLSNADLSNALLKDTVLQGANLTGADLTESSLIEANLQNADLSGAKLIKANLEEADLTNADLSASQCREATFTATILRGTDFRTAILDGATFSNCDLSKVLNLTAEQQQSLTVTE